MRLSQLQMRNVWGVGGDGVIVDLQPSTNVIIGKNNSGKSSLLRAVRTMLELSNEFVQAKASASLPPTAPHDTGSGDRADACLISLDLDVPADDVVGPWVAAEAGLDDEARKHFHDRLTAAVQGGVTLRIEGTSVRLEDFAIFTNGDVIAEADHDEDFKEQRNPHFETWKQLRPKFWSHLLQRWVGSVADIHGWRTVSEQIVYRIGNLRSPSSGAHSDRKTYLRIRDFFRRLSDLQDAELATSGNELNIETRGMYLPITSFGDGIQHLLLMAYYLAAEEPPIALLEEPETHLHPAMQRHLLELIRESNAQVVATTHSSVLLDEGRWPSILHVEHDGQSTKVGVRSGLADLYEVLDDLGARPSDILQANVVIWVEGPTDRMFLLKCFELLNQEFREGIDFQLALYGGRLMSHYTVDDHLTHLIDLRRFCRRAVVVVDSDKGDPNDTISGTKARLQKETEGAGGRAWVTDGREIENYLTDRVFEEVYADWFGAERAAGLSIGKFDRTEAVVADRFPANTVAPGDKWKVNYASNKVRIMAELLQRLTPGDIGEELRTRLQDVVSFIRESNRGTRQVESVNPSRH